MSVSTRYEQVQLLARKHARGAMQRRYRRDARAVTRGRLLRRDASAGEGETDGQRGQGRVGRACQGGLAVMREDGIPA